MTDHIHIDCYAPLKPVLKNRPRRFRRIEVEGILVTQTASDLIGIFSLQSELNAKVGNGIIRPAVKYLAGDTLESYHTVVSLCEYANVVGAVVLKRTVGDHFEHRLNEVEVGDTSKNTIAGYYILISP